MPFDPVGDRRARATIASDGGAGMTTRTMLPQATQITNVALVWIDREHAVILTGGADGTNAVACLDRDSDEGLEPFETRTIEHVVDDDQVLVSGPAFARTSFERRYVAVTHRPDRLVDIEPTILAHRLSGFA
jgi:hypothetical protein